MSDSARRGSTRSREGRPIDSPYKGLMPYSEEDAPFFFGREAEREIIAANLMASRLTLLYGASGVGKSSVLRAGVARYLREQAVENVRTRGTPEFGVVVFSSWRYDPMTALVERVRESLAGLLPAQGATRGKAHDAAVDGPADPTRQFPEYLDAWTRAIGGDLLVVLDQFEEYFLYHGREDGETTFAAQFPHAVNRQGLRVNFLISMREDALAQLDRFKGRIPNLFDNYLRVEHLDREAARAAIVRPLEPFNRQHPDAPPVTIEPALVEQVLDQVRTGEVVLGEGGQGSVAAAGGETRIETPYLQLVMTRLWEEESREGSRVLRQSTLQRLGGAERIVRTHLDAAMAALPPDEQETAARMFRMLVTPSGTKIAHTVKDLAAYAELPRDQLEPVLEKLSGRGRILRPVAPPPDQPELPRYEIFHDVLAPAILDWRRRYAERQQQAEIRREEEQRRAQEQAELFRQRERERSRLMRIGLVIAAVLLLLLTGATYLAFVQRAEAVEQRFIAEEERVIATAARDSIANALVYVREAQAAAAMARDSLRLALDRVTAEQQRTTDALELAQQRYDRIVAGLELKEAFLSGNQAALRAAASSLVRNDDIRFNATRSEELYVDRGSRSNYDYTIFPESPDLGSVAVITYRFEHESFGNSLVTVGPEQNFRAGYRGWGCLERVYALIEYRDVNRPPSMSTIDMCEIVGGPVKQPE